MSNKMIITKNREFSCSFTIKASGTTLAIELDLTDTGTITFSTTGPDPEVIIANKVLTLGDSESRLSGQMFLTLTPEETALLHFDNQFGEDGFPLVSTTKAILDINTIAEGKIYAMIPNIYINDTGE